jgi:hypothetical protein
MLLYPQLGPQYYDEKHKGILSRMEAFYAQSITISQSFWGEADLDTRFWAGDQSVFSDAGLYGNLPANRRRQFNFNRIRRVTNMISGHQRRNRKSTIVAPVENGDSDTADQFSKILMHIHQTENVYETISDSFEGALVSGMNLLQVWIDYRSDPVNGVIRVDNCSYNSFLIDVYFKKHDLSDCTGIWKRSWLSKKECISLMPDKTEEILGLYGSDSGNGRDGKFMFMPESYNYGMNNLLTYDEFYYRDYRTQKMLVDTQTGETLEWRNQDNDRLKEFLRQNPSVTMIEQEIPTVRLAIVIQGKVMYDGPQPMGIDQYPFVPVYAYYSPQMPYFPYRVQGIVRGLRDAQYLYNRRRAIELDILESQITSGWIYKENALVNPKDVFLAGQGRGLALKEEAQMTDVQQIMPPQVPPSMIQLSELLAKEVMEISGVNEELLGSAVDEKAGILSMLRQGAGLTTLQGLFDQLDTSQKLLGRLMIDLIQANYTPGKIKKILEGSEPAPQFYNKAFGKYHAVVEEGLNTTTQKQMQFAQLLQLRETGVPIPNDVLLEACTLQEKSKLIESIKKAEQAQAQMQQQQQEAAIAEQMARTKLAEARTIADQGLGLERVSRVEENQALAIERRAKAHNDEELALLNFAKALKEIDSVDLSHLEKLLSLSQIMKQQELALETKASDSAKATSDRSESAKVSAGPLKQPPTQQLAS